MDIMQAMQARHSVRAYEDREILPQTAAALQAEIDRCNEESGLKIRFVQNEEKVFSSPLAHYGKFSGVKNYLVLAGNKSEDLEKKAGYYGERLVLFAQTLGLNSCWVALTCSRRTAKKMALLSRDERLACVIAIGYGKTQGVAHKGKTADRVCDFEDAEDRKNPPEWFIKGIEAALLAPTAINQQKFLFTLKKDGKVLQEQKGGVCRGLDFGIVRYHFEIGAGKENLDWENSDNE